MAMRDRSVQNGEVAVCVEKNRESSNCRINKVLAFRLRKKNLQSARQVPLLFPLVAALQPGASSRR